MQNKLIGFKLVFSKVHKEKIVLLISQKNNWVKSKNNYLLKVETS